MVSSQGKGLILYAATVTSSIRPIEGSRGSARMPLGRLQGRPTAARGRLLLASFVGCIFIADRRTESGYSCLPGMRMIFKSQQGSDYWDQVHQPLQIRVNLETGWRDSGYISVGREGHLIRDPSTSGPNVKRGVSIIKITEHFPI